MEKKEIGPGSTGWTKWKIHTTIGPLPAGTTVTAQSQPWLSPLSEWVEVRTESGLAYELQLHQVHWD